MIPLYMKLYSQSNMEIVQILSKKEKRKTYITSRLKPNHKPAGYYIH